MAKVAAAKTVPTTDSVPAFLDAIADPAQREDCRALVPLMQKATGDEPRMWGSSNVAGALSRAPAGRPHGGPAADRHAGRAAAPSRGAAIVGFGEVYCPGSGGRVSRAPLLGFAPRKCAISVYLIDGIDRHEAELAALGPHDRGKGCLYLWNLASVKVPVLERILAASVKNARRQFPDRPPG
jgi:hypothetical protein